MRILVISHMYPNLVSPLGGIFVKKQVEALAKLGIDVKVISPIPWVPFFLKGKTRWGGYPGVPRYVREGALEVFYPRVLEFPRSYLFEYSPFTYVQSLKKIFREQANNGVDLIHAHVAHPDGAAAIKLAEEFSLPVVVTVHGQDFAYTLKRSKTCEQSVKNTLKEAKRVILVSNKLRERYGLKEWADDLDKYRVIYNGVDLEESKLEDYNLEEANRENVSQEKTSQVDTNLGDTNVDYANLDNDNTDYCNLENSPVRCNHNHVLTYRRILLSVGFLRPDKGHALVLKALPALIKEFPNLIYRIVGDGEERQRLEGLVRELKLEAYVEFLGSLPHEKTMQEMAKCEIFVLPSINEAFGVVYLEAMAQAKPIIGTKGEGIAELLESYDIGEAVEPSSVEEVLSALQKLLRNPLSSKEKGQRGRELVLREFTWDSNARRTLQVYQEVLSDSKTRNA